MGLKAPKPSKPSPAVPEASRQLFDAMVRSQAKLRRRRSRWVRRLIHNNRRFARFLETNFVSEYGEKTSLLELTTNPKYGWDTKDMDQRKMLAQRADAWASICMPIMTADGKPPKETV